MTGSRSRSAGLPALSPNAWLRYDAVQRLLPVDVHDVLEIGCGRGGFAARFSQRFGYVGLEPDPVSYRTARDAVRGRARRGEVRNGDVSSVQPDERFDLVCAFEVLEHIEDDRGALVQWIRHLRPGGWLLLSTPAWQRRFAAADVKAGHFRRYEPPALRELLVSVGLCDVQTRLYGGLLGYLLEHGRNLLASWSRPDADSIDDRTRRSGRWLQPDGPVAGTVTMLATAPFRRLQRMLPESGPGVIAIGRRPRP
jgi:SAM-dependent methyltransferase